MRDCQHDRENDRLPVPRTKCGKLRFPRYFFRLFFSPRMYIFVALFHRICRVRSRDWRRAWHFHTWVFLTFTLILTLSLSSSPPRYVKCYLRYLYVKCDRPRRDARERSLVSPLGETGLCSIFLQRQIFAARESREAVENIQDVPRETDRDLANSACSREGRFSGLEILPRSNDNDNSCLESHRTTGFTAATHRSLGTPCIRVIRWSARYLRTLWIYNLLNTVLFLLSIVIVEQSVHIKYTKSTQRQKRLVSSRKIAYKIFALSPFHSLPLLWKFLSSFFFYFFITSPSRRAKVSPFLYLALRMRSSIRPFDEGKGTRAW